LNDFLDPIRERRAYYAAQPGLVEEILVAGTRRMQEEARETMALAYEAMGLYGIRLRRQIRAAERAELPATLPLAVNDAVGA
jgi:tryptophanyl-tRNA synthetase